MNKTSPIKSMEDLDNFRMYYVSVHPSPRNRLLIVMGLNTALRISDLLSIRWRQVYDFKSNRIRSHLNLKEQKTGKHACVYINNALRGALLDYIDVHPAILPDEHIFISQKHTPLSRTQAYRIISNAAKSCGIDGVIGCHSMRKTFAYHAWKEGAAEVQIMAILNHSSFAVTKRYLGIEQDEKDEVYKNIYR